MEWANHFQKGDPRVINHVTAGYLPPHAMGQFPNYRGHPNYQRNSATYGYRTGYGAGYGVGYGSGYGPDHPSYHQNLPYGELHDGYARGYAYNVSPIRAITKRGD